MKPAKTKKITLRFTKEEYDLIRQKAEAIRSSTYGFAMAAVRQSVVKTSAAKALLRRAAKITTAEILESVVMIAPIRAATTPEEIQIFREILDLEERLINTLNNVEATKTVSLKILNEIRELLNQIKESYILKIDR